MQPISYRNQPIFNQDKVRQHRSMEFTNIFKSKPTSYEPNPSEALFYDIKRVKYLHGCSFSSYTEFLNKDLDPNTWQAWFYEILNLDLSKLDEHDKNTLDYAIKKFIFTCPDFNFPSKKSEQLIRSFNLIKEAFPSVDSLRQSLTAATINIIQYNYFEIQDALKIIPFYRKPNDPDSNKIISSLESSLYKNFRVHDKDNEEKIADEIAQIGRAFSRVCYLPKQFIPLIEAELGNPSISFSIKMSYFEALGGLGYTEVTPILEEFLTYPECRKMNFTDQYKLLYAVACLYPIGKPIPNYLMLMMDQMLDVFQTLPPEIQFNCPEIFSALGNERALKFLNVKIRETTKSSYQEKITNLIRKAVYAVPELRTLEILEESRVGSRNVDLLIKGKKASLVCEIDTTAYHCCINDAKRILGTDTVRNKSLLNLGYHVFNFRSQDDRDAQIRSLVEFLKSI